MSYNYKRGWRLSGTNWLLPFLFWLAVALIIALASR
jgi:hypothetical protein